MNKNYFGIYKPDTLKLHVIYEYNSKGIKNIFFANNNLQLKIIKKIVSKNAAKNQNNEFQKIFNLYFIKKIDLPDIPLDIKFTSFQNEVLSHLRKNIKFGQNITYLRLGEKVFNSKNYSRAVGNAMNKNPVPLYFPCHRVIGANNTLVGFGSGIKIKKLLLKFENILQ